MSQTHHLNAVYSIDQAARLTGLSQTRLMAWDRAGFFSPEYADQNRRLPLSRLYSFNDIVGLKTLAQLRDRHHVTMRALRKVADTLAGETSRPWSDLSLTALNRDVVRVDDDGNGVGVIDGQRSCIQLKSVIDEVRDGANKLRERDPQTVGRTERSKFILHNAERIAGTRIPVSTVAGYLKDGADDQAVIEAFPDLTEADVEAVRQLIAQAAA